MLPLVSDAITLLFYDAFAALRLEQLVLLPTRLRNILDIVLTLKQPSNITISQFYDAGAVANSDHSAVPFVISLHNTTSNVKCHYNCAPMHCFSKCNFS